MRLLELLQMLGGRHGGAKIESRQSESLIRTLTFLTKQTMGHCVSVPASITAPAPPALSTTTEITRGSLHYLNKKSSIERKISHLREYLALASTDRRVDIQAQLDALNAELTRLFAVIESLQTREDAEKLDDWCNWLKTTIQNGTSITASEFLRVLALEPMLKRSITRLQSQPTNETIVQKIKDMTRDLTIVKYVKEMRYDIGEDISGEAVRTAVNEMLADYDAEQIAAQAAIKYSHGDCGPCNSHNSS